MPAENLEKGNREKKRLQNLPSYKEKGKVHFLLFFLAQTTVVAATANSVVNPMYGANRLSLLV